MILAFPYSAVCMRLNFPIILSYPEDLRKLTVASRRCFRLSVRDFQKVVLIRIDDLRAVRLHLADELPPVVDVNMPVDMVCGMVFLNKIIKTRKSGVAGVCVIPDSLCATECSPHCPSSVYCLHRLPRSLRYAGRISRQALRHQQGQSSSLRCRRGRPLYHLSKFCSVCCPKNRDFQLSNSVSSEHRHVRHESRQHYRLRSIRSEYPQVTFFVLTWDTPYYFALRCLTASYMKIPAATDALSEFILPNIGSFTIKSHFFCMSGLMPKPSEPITKAAAPVRSVS